MGREKEEREEKRRGEELSAMNGLKNECARH